jgi:hypothetical protein
MKNLIKFLLFVGLLSAGISALYDYRLKHGGLNLAARVTPEHPLRRPASSQKMW